MFSLLFLDLLDKIRFLYAKSCGTCSQSSIGCGRRSASVIGPDAGLCDALATALMVAGKDGAKWFGLPELASYSAWAVNRNENTAWSVND
jgi:hypothetical protein